MSYFIGVAILPRFLDSIRASRDVVPRKLQPTMPCWMLFVGLIEFLSRD